jgi:hypothetical protein
MNSLIDNDVLLKGACYGLLADLLPSERAPIGVLGSAHFVLAKKITRLKLTCGAANALSRLREFISRSVTIEPTPDEIGFAADLESVALRSQLSLDTGESLLCAVLVTRLVPCLLTGDKRAIRAIEVLLEAVPQLGLIGGRVRCLEQLVLDCLTRGVGATLRNAICSEPGIDRTLSICFSCTSSTWTETNSFEGIASYIEALRCEAPRVLSA